MASGQQAAVGAICRSLHGGGLRLLKRYAGQSGINSTVKTTRQVLRNVLSRLHLGARWLLLRERGGLSGIRPHSSVPVLLTGGLFYKSKLPAWYAEMCFCVGFSRLPLITTGVSNRQHSTVSLIRSVAQSRCNFILGRRLHNLCNCLRKLCKLTAKLCHSRLQQD
jgi:hypothetical protein